jgi:hypothetical protein
MPRRRVLTTKTLLVAAGALAVLVLALAFFRFKTFVDDDPRLCATCHRSSPEFALWMRGTHRGVACQRCHHARPEEGVAMLGAFIAGKKPAAHGTVEIGACAECHLSHDPRWPDVGGSRGHRIHYEENKIACVQCHAASMHGFEPIAARCAACHPGHAVGLERMQGMHCFACHEFLSDEPGLRPTRRDCMRCHTAQGIHAPMNEHGGPMEISCASCHRPHAPPGETLVACADCHAPEGLAKAGLHGSPGHRACTDCHAPHTWTAEPASCARCHPGAEGHAKGRACAECHSFAGAPLPELPSPSPPPSEQ